MRGPGGGRAGDRRDLLAWDRRRRAIHITGVFGKGFTPDNSGPVFFDTGPEPHIGGAKLQLVVTPGLRRLRKRGRRPAWAASLRREVSLPSATPSTCWL